MLLLSLLAGRALSITPVPTSPPTRTPTPRATPTPTSFLPTPTPTPPVFPTPTWTPTAPAGTTPTTTPQAGQTITWTVTYTCHPPAPQCHVYPWTNNVHYTLQNPDYPGVTMTMTTP